MLRGLPRTVCCFYLIVTLAVPISAGIALAGGKGEASRAQAVAGTGLPLPRFVSVKSDRVNLRSGPGTDYPALWVLRRAGMPVEIIKEFDAWRQVRDADGVSGWVLRSFLSGRRTAIVLPWAIKADTSPPQAQIREEDAESARPIAIVEAGVIANVHHCDGTWCKVSIGTHKGFIEQKSLWGVYPGEKLR